MQDNTPTSMTMIEIAKLENGAHNNQTVYNAVVPIPEGWALVPEEMLPLENFPFGDCEVTEIDDVMTVTSWSPLPIPPPPPEPEPEPSEFDKLNAQVLYTAVMTDTLLVEEDEET